MYCVFLKYYIPLKYFSMFSNCLHLTFDIFQDNLMRHSIKHMRCVMAEADPGAAKPLFALPPQDLLVPHELEVEDQPELTTDEHSDEDALAQEHGNL